MLVKWEALAAPVGVHGKHLGLPELPGFCVDSISLSAHWDRRIMTKVLLESKWGTCQSVTQ